ncbi:fimbrial subunit [Proteus mirabilis]|uniref:Fimbrial subunit n=1 Tax=Proteus mirabilis TaxID=584 RepID=A0A2X2BVF2_PROMI|nr:fimbrial subunit [Proteus mirabilis]
MLIFRGILTSTTCQLSSDSLEQEIAINNLRWQYLNEYGRSPIKYFFSKYRKM